MSSKTDKNYKVSLTNANDDETMEGTKRDNDEDEETRQVNKVSRFIHDSSEIINVNRGQR